MPHDEGLDRLLSGFVDDTPGTVHALVVSVDGLRLARSGRLGPATADQLSAAACSLVSLAGGAALLVGLGGVRQTIVELEQGHLYLSRLVTGDTLAVIAELGCDMGRVGYEMTLLGARVGEALVANPAPAPWVGG